MKGIRSIEVNLVGVPLVEAFKTAHSVKDIQRSVVVVVRDADGATGIGNIDPSPGYSKESVADHFRMLRDHFAPAMIGADPANIHAMMARLDAIDPAFFDAKAALEMACLDLVARRAGISVATMLGGAVVDEIRFNAWVGMLAPDEAARQAVGWQAKGFRSCKVKVGGDVGTDIDRVLAVREAVGPGFEIRADANEGFSEADAIAFITGTARAALQLVEQPVAWDDLPAMARIRRHAQTVGVPLMADESVLDHASLVEILRMEAADIVKVKVMKQGGMLGTRRMIATAEAAGVRCVIGHGFGLGVNTMAEMIVASTSLNVIEGVECVGPLKTRDDIVVDKLDLSRGVLPLSDAPGLGVELDESRMERYRLDSASIG
jgi:L-alanine-DL-glutamate epimerase-like enolase superfamily enzyme